MVLSTRCLFSTDGQIYFLCQQGTALELVAVSSEMDLPSLGPRKVPSYALSTDLTNRRQRLKGSWQFFEDLYNYKCRKLSFDIDSLSAFHGVLKRSGFKDIWGIPIACHIIGNPLQPIRKDSGVEFAYFRTSNAVIETWLGRSAANDSRCRWPNNEGTQRSMSQAYTFDNRQNLSCLRSVARHQLT
jgi:hypothetical protein